MSGLDEPILPREQSIPRTRSMQIARSLSRTLGAPVLPEVDEAGDARNDDILARQRSERLNNRAQTDANVVREALVRSAIVAGVATLVIIVAMIASYIACILALIKCAQRWHAPCDAPLQQYVALCFFGGPTLNKIFEKCARLLFRSPRGRTVYMSVVCMIPSIGLAITGACLLSQLPEGHCDVEVLSSAGLYIRLQCVSCAVNFIFGVSLTVFLIWAARHGYFQKNKGCSVNGLRKVSFYAESMRDSQDGGLLECPICYEEFSPEVPILQTPCEHLFHKTCLAKWCRGSQFCPLCRQVVSEEELESGDV